MKRLMIIAGLMATASAYPNWQIIREFEDRGAYFRIFKFQDGPNDCYVVTKDSFEAGPGISCVKR